METTIVYWVCIGCLRFRVLRFRAYLDPPMQFLFGFGMVFWLGLSLGLPKQSYIGGPR